MHIRQIPVPVEVVKEVPVPVERVVYKEVLVPTESADMDKFRSGQVHFFCARVCLKRKSTAQIIW